ncbi:MAG TPA: HAD family hydrolase [Gemmatimonadaceae bacterium]|nr:HAD family hydrolase [Gemmatimonadaceae bacterium]
MSQIDGGAPRERGGGAVFIDRDGTLIRDMNYIGDPALVQLVPDAAHSVRRLNEAGWPVVIVTNQSGIARGFFTTDDYDRVKERIESQLREAGARIDATYMCPHHPDYGGPCDCRKPGTLLFRQAAEALGLELPASWYVGDKLRDILPAATLGGQGILVPNEYTPRDDVARARAEFEVAASLEAAVARVLHSAR